MKRSVDSVTIPHGLKNRKVEPPSTAPKVEGPDHPPHLFPLHTLAAFVGSRGSGKTNACILLAQQYYDAKAFNRIFIISPTIESNPSFKVLPTLESDIYKDGAKAQEALEDIQNKIKEDVRDYEASIKYQLIFKKHTEGRPLSVHEASIMSIMGGEKPVVLEKPCPLIIIDDMSHSPIYSTSRGNPFINLCLRHRHVAGVGVSIFMLVQTFKTGVPRGLRQNVQLWFLFKTQDRQSVDFMYEEFASYVTKEQFDELYDYATDTDHDFLTVDLQGPPAGRFRKNFDEILVPP